MVDIASGDVSAVIHERKPIGPDSGQGPTRIRIRVRATLTVDPGTDDAYPTGGIPLQGLFTAGGASDTKLDTRQPIIQIGPVLMRAAAATFTPAMPGYFHQAGVAATDQKLRLYLGAANASAVAHSEHPNSDITAATSFNGDTDPVCDLVLEGLLRHGETI